MLSKYKITQCAYGFLAYERQWTDGIFGISWRYNTINNDGNIMYRDPPPYVPSMAMAEALIEKRKDNLLLAENEYNRQSQRVVKRFKK